MKRSSGSPELIINYKQFLLTFQLHDHDLPGFAFEFRVSLKFHMIVLVLLHEIERSSGPSELLITYEQYLLTFKLYNPHLLEF